MIESENSPPYNTGRAAMEETMSIDPGTAAALQQYMKDDRWRAMIGGEEEDLQLVLPMVIAI